MISTMPKDGQAPTSPNAMPGGLGAILQQPNTAPTGASSKSIQSMIDMARNMSDGQLADVLSGRSLDVPQYVAMTEAMGRKSLRTAVQGAQAQQALHQPSVKDKLMAEEAAQQMAGIAQLPAQNMESVDMAAGGIVAFSGKDNDSLVEDNTYDPWAVSTPQLSGFDKKVWQAIKDKIGEWNQPWGKTINATPEQIQGLRGGRLPAGSLAAEQAKTNTPTINETPTGAQLAALQKGGPQDPNYISPEMQAEIRRLSAANPPATGGGSQKAGIAALMADDNAKQAEQSALAKLTGTGDKMRSGLDELKKQNQAEIAWNLAGAMFGTPNMAMALSKGLPLIASTAAAGRKERAGLEKEANEYDLNVARYQDALASGDKDRALKYKELAENARYHMAMVNKPSDMMQLLGALRDPETLALYKTMNEAKKPTDVVPKSTALKEWNDMMPTERRKYGNDFNTYYSSLSGTMGGGTGSLQEQAAAILASRKSKT